MSVEVNEPLSESLLIMWVDVDDMVAISGVSTTGGTENG
jgi:hypothetical protein